MDLRIKNARAVPIPKLWNRLGLHGDPPSGGKTVKSPFREEKRASFWISRDGLRFKDMGNPECTGSPIDFVMQATGKPFKEAVDFILGDESKVRLQYHERHVPTEMLFDEKILDQLESANRGDILEWLDEKGIDRSYAENGMLRTHNGRLAFVFSKGVKCRPRLRDSHSAFWLTGGGHRCLFLEQLMTGAPIVIITEGETDAIALRTHLFLWDLLGTVDVLGAPGASWTPNIFWMGALSGKVIHPAGDGDEAGAQFDRRVYLGFGKEERRGPLQVVQGEDVGSMLLKDPEFIRKRINGLVDKTLDRLLLTK